MTIGIIGGGVMGEVIIKALENRAIVTKNNILVTDLNQDRLKYLKETFDIQTTTMIENFSKCSIIILAVKPQSFGMIRADFSNSLIISIMAGVNIKKIQEQLNSRRIIRAMPNTPAQINLGMTVWMANNAVTEVEKKITVRIFKALGKEIEVDNEDKINLATALTGSGPAYVFYLAEQIEDQAKDMGFSQEQATVMTKQLFIGAATLLNQSADSVAELRQKVSSKGGTTAAALEVFRKKDFAGMMKKALGVAYERAKKLSFIDVL